MNGLKFYDKLKSYVGTSRGLGFPDDETQQARLELAARLLNKHKAESLLDIGCGYGDLRMHVLRCSPYLGIDVNEAFIEEARRRMPLTPFKHVALSDFQPDPLRFDAVAALGVIATTSPDELADTVDLIARHARRLMLLSFIPDDIGYTGSVTAYSIDDVVRGRKVLETGEACGEITVLIDIAR